MKQILLIALIVLLLPSVLFAFWMAFAKPEMLDAADDYPVLSENNDVKGDLS